MKYIKLTRGYFTIVDDEDFDYPNRDKFMAYISKDSRRHYLGWFHSEQDAAAAYNAKARELHGEFATMNDL